MISKQIKSERLSDFVINYLLKVQELERRETKNHEFWDNFFVFHLYTTFEKVIEIEHGLKWVKQIFNFILFKWTRLTH